MTGLIKYSPREPISHWLIILLAPVLTGLDTASLPVVKLTELSVHWQETLSQIGWTKQEVLNTPNAISLARLVSGPAIAILIMHQQWAPAMASLAVAGASDWLDGFVARRWGQSSVLGTYLDPLADKVLICSTVGALGAEVS